MRQWYRNLRNRELRGQSLVEVALFLPILIIVLAGLVEVSNLLVTQNRVTTASRIAAGFGSANFKVVNWADEDSGDCVGGIACDMGVVAINTVTETLDLSPDVWDVWSIHALFNDAGTDFEVFTHTHAYGNYQVIPLIEWTQNITDVKNDMKADLQKDGVITNTKNLGVVASVAYHDIGTILGIPVWQWTGLQTIRGLTVMRVDNHPDFLGCPILPIAVRFDQWSLYPTNWEDENGDPVGPNLSPDADALTDTYPPINAFPGPDKWKYPDGSVSETTGEIVPVPAYTNINTPTITTMQVSPDHFTENVPGVSFMDAQAGYLYWARDIKSKPDPDDPYLIDLSGNFGWLSWRDEAHEQALEASLMPPSGNFVSEVPGEGYAGGPMDMNLPTICPKPWDVIGDEDGHLAVDEWISVGPGNINAGRIKEYLRYYVDNEIVVMLIIFDYSNLAKDPYNPLTCGVGGGSNAYFHVIDFAKVKLVGWRYETNDKWLVIEFVDWGFECRKPDPDS